MCTRGPRALSGLSLAVLLASALGVGSSAHAQGGKWTVEVEPVYMQIYGHDQHVLTIHEIDLDATPRVDNKTAVSLDTDDTFAYRGEFQYTRGQWGLGVDFFWLIASQKVGPLTAAADGPSGPIDQVVFEIAGRGFTSSSPSQVLLYRRLEDTDLAFWTLDLYALRTLAETPKSAVRLQFGLRTGDFDNDYHAVVGVENVGGVRLDASSNYDRMMGPLVGLLGSFHWGRHSLEGYLGQSVLLGTAEKLSITYREFTGPLSDAFVGEAELPTTFATASFRGDQVDVAIPISELRLKWTLKLSELISLVAGTQASAWFDVSVPPGVVPGEDGDEVFHENTIVSIGLFSGVKVTF